jgi:hypothetical protein
MIFAVEMVAVTENCVDSSLKCALVIVKNLALGNYLTYSFSNQRLLLRNIRIAKLYTPPLIFLSVFSFLRGSLILRSRSFLSNHIPAVR